MTIWSDDGAQTSDEWVRRYLALVGIDVAPPSPAALAALTRAHVLTVAFENVTAQLRRAAQPEGSVPPLDAEALLRNWEERRGGGVCFELAPMFTRLIDALGYRASLVQGQISFPGSHQCVLVELDGARYFADIGNGAPFFDPIPLDNTVEIHHLGLSYRFGPSESPDQWLQERLIHGDWQAFCRYDLRPSTRAEFNTAFQTHHTPGQGWVMDNLRLVRIRESELLSLFDSELTRFSSVGKQTESIPDAVTLERVVADTFGLPNVPVTAAQSARRARTVVTAAD